MELSGFIIGIFQFRNYYPTEIWLYVSSRCHIN